MERRHFICLISLLFFLGIFSAQAQNSWVTTKNGQFFLANEPYYYLGTNYWYGGLLSLQKNPQRGKERLRKELDFLHNKGVNNLRVVVGAEGAGLVNGVQRIGPPLQTEQGKFDVSILESLDYLLFEMGKRNMKVVLYLSNNWEWSGGFLQYLNWNGLIPDSIFKRKLNWDEQRDYTSKFYTCDACKEAYLKQADFIITHTNKFSHKKYTDDPTIMAWELANEPRPMRPSVNKEYSQWIGDAAAHIKSKDKNHLVTIGHEGEMGSESLKLFEDIHADKNIDYLTIHIWPKNWGWFSDTAIQKSFSRILSSTENYISKHIAVAQKLNKPLVIEEFGLPRDNQSFDPAHTTSLRDVFYNQVFSIWQNSQAKNGVVAGVAFWTFGGTARPKKGQVFWKKGDDYMGDPPMEEQGLNTVFDSDKTTWQIIESYTKASPALIKKISTDLPIDAKATKETVNLYRNLKKLSNKGFMFGHQDDLAYGVEWKYKEGRSDIKDVTGDYPAVYGWELGGMERVNNDVNLDAVPFKKMKEYIKLGYERGGVITVSWHADSPFGAQKGAWDTTHGTVASILPGGANHILYKGWLDRIAAFLSSLKGSKGEAIPVLFRPFHEHTGNWFWWGKNASTSSEYTSLWRFTVYYLQKEKKLHNLLWVYNTGGDFKTKEEFLERYPGDDVVDMLSFDTYQYGDPQKEKWFEINTNKMLTMVGEIAKEKNKLLALAETGYEAIPYPAWWTETLLNAIGDNKISYVLLWRNHGYNESTKKMHYYAPYKGQVSEQDFIKFYNLDKTLFEKDISSEKLYQ